MNNIAEENIVGEYGTVRELQHDLPRQLKEDEFFPLTEDHQTITLAFNEYSLQIECIDDSLTKEVKPEDLIKDPRVSDLYKFCLAYVQTCFIKESQGFLVDLHMKTMAQDAMEPFRN